MGDFSPLREGFRELNNLLLDRQQWDAKHAERKAAQETNRLNQLNSFEQQKFQNQMAIGNQELKKLGQEQTARAFDFEVQKADRKYALDLKKWEADKDRQADVREAHKAGMTEFQDKQNELLKLAKPQEVNFAVLGVDERMFTNPGFVEYMGSWLEKRGERLGDDGKIYDTATGELKLVPGNDQNENLHYAVRAGEMFETTPEDTQDSLDLMIEEYEALEIKSKLGGHSTYSHGDRARAKRDMHELKPLIEETEEQLSDEGLAEYYDDLATRLTKNSQWFGKGGETEMAAGSLTMAKVAQDKANSYRDQHFGTESRDATQEDMLERGKQKGEKEAKPPTGLMTEKQMVSTIEGFYGTKDALGNIIVGDKLQPKILTVEGVANRLAKQLAEERGVRSDMVRADAVQAAKEEVEALEKGYFSEIEKAKTMPEQRVKLMIKTHFPNFKDKNVDRMRKHIVKKVEAGHFFKLELQRLAGDKKIPTYKPSRKIAQMRGGFTSKRGR